MKLKNKCILFYLFLILSILKLEDSLYSQSALESTSSFTPDIFPHLRFQHIGFEQGLEQRDIWSIIQDSQGFLWLGTSEGLVRYDGYHFRTFTQQPYDSTTLSHNHIHCLYEDSRGWLWVGTADGLNCYRRETERFWRIPILPDSVKNLAAAIVYSICEDPTGAIWAGSSVGLSHLTFSEDINSVVECSSSFQLDKSMRMHLTHILPYPNNPRHFKNVIYSLLIDRRGVVWVETAAGLSILLTEPAEKSILSGINPSSFIFHNFTANKNKSGSLSEYSIFQLLEDYNGNIWAVTYQGLTRIDSRIISRKELLMVDSFEGDHLKFKDYTVADPLFFTKAMLEFPGGKGSKIWIGLEGNGFVVFDPQSETYRHYQAELRRDFNPLIPYTVLSFYRDYSGIVWVGTGGGGLHKFNPFANRFSDYHSSLEEIHLNSLIDMRFVFQDSRGDLWIANDAVYRCDRHSRGIKLVLWKPESDSDWTFKNAILEDQNGHIWIASEYRGLYRYDPSQEKIVRCYRFKVSRSDSSEVSENITSLTEDCHGSIWAGSIRAYSKGRKITEKKAYLYELTPGSEEVLQYQVAVWNDRTGLNIKSYIYDILMDSLGIAWLGTGFGFVRFEPKTGAIKQYQYDPNNPLSLSHNQVHSVMADPFFPQRYLWLGTDGGGLNRFNIKTEIFTHYTVQNGLPSNVISSILCDDEGDLWLGTENGISHAILHPKQREVICFRNYDRSDGLNDNDFSFFYGQNAYKNARGEMFFAGAKGFNIFHPSEIVDNPHPPSVVITSFKIWNEPVSPGDFDSPLKYPITQTREIVLPYNQNMIAFEMAALDFSAQNKNQYAFKLENWNPGWAQNGTNRMAQFTNLPPGEYVFRARGANSDGVWNEQGASIRITIMPPWWQKWWAYMLYALFTISVLYGLHHYENSRRRLKHKLELEQVQTEKYRELDHIKSRFFANISHELRTPLTLILGPLSRVSSKIRDRKLKGDLNLIQQHTNQLSRFINDLLDLAKFEAGKVKLQAKPHDVVQLLKYYAYLFQSISEQKNITLRFQSEIGSLVLYVDKDKIEKVFNNLLANAVKFTPENGSIEVTIFKPSEGSELSEGLTFVQIQVKDSGIGIPAEHLPHVFDRFYQADDVTTRKYGGTGIGSALVKEVVELHYGTIDVESREGEGSIFKIYLPIGKDHLKNEEIIETSEIDAEEILSSDASALANAEVSIKKVSHVDPLFMPKGLEYNDFIIEADGDTEACQDMKLFHDDIIVQIIEDNSNMRSYIRSLLPPVYKAIEAKDGNDGIQKAFQFIPDLIICDIMMPGKDGYKVCYELKNDDKTSHIPIILLTAKAAQEDKIKGLECNADAYIIKPFDPKELLVRVNNLIELRRKLSIKFSKEHFADSTETIFPGNEQEFISRAIAIVENRMENPIFSVDDLAKALAMSRSQLHRKFRALTNQSTTQFIHTVRLHKAAALLKQNDYTISEVAYKVGFDDAGYFTRIFQRQYGKSPREFIKG